MSATGSLTVIFGAERVTLDPTEPWSKFNIAKTKIEALLGSVRKNEWPHGFDCIACKEHISSHCHDHAPMCLRCARGAIRRAEGGE